MDEKSLQQIYKTCYPQIVSYIMNHNGTADQAKEAFHAALGAMLNQIDKGNQIGDYNAYLFRSAWNAFLAEKKHGGRFGPPDQSSPNEPVDPDDPVSPPILGGVRQELIEPGPGPDYLIHRQMVLDGAMEAIATLTPAQQRVLTLTFDPDQDLDDSQIAEIMGVSTDYVKVARHRAMQALREKMQQRGFTTL